MRKLLISLFALLLLAACSSGNGDQSTAADQAAGVADAAGEVADAVTVPGTSAVTVGQVAIEGKLGCGHCAYHVGEDCSAAVQTADGTVYILEDVGEGDPAFDQRFDGKSIKVTGTSVERDGVGYVAVETIEL